MVTFVLLHQIFFCGYGKFSSFFELPREKTIISLKDKYFGSEFGVTHDDDVNESYITADNKGWDGTGPVAFSAKKIRKLKVEKI